MLLFLTAAASLVLSVTLVEAAAFPSSIEKCKAGDVKCLAMTMTKFIQTHPDGLPELGLKALDPFVFDYAKIQQQSSGPLSLNISISNGSILGWQKMSIEKVIGFEMNPRKSQFEIHARVPVDTILGTYDLSAQAILIPVKGNGAVNLTFENLEMTIKLKTKVVSRDGADYLQVNKVNMKIAVDRMHSNFENLFSELGLGENTNALMNEYQEQLFAEISGSFAKARSELLQAYIAPVFDRFPYRSFFAE